MGQQKNLASPVLCGKNRRESRSFQLGACITEHLFGGNQVGEFSEFRELVETARRAVSTAYVRLGNPCQALKHLPVSSVGRRDEGGAGTSNLTRGKQEGRPLPIRGLPPPGDYAGHDRRTGLEGGKMN